jgi:predicted nucleic acid-binding protein
MGWSRRDPKVEGFKVITYVIDASVAVKWYSSVGEGDLLKADKLLQMYVEGSCDFMAPTLIAYELANALRFNPNFDIKDVKRALKDFAELQVNLQPPFEYLRSAIDLAFKYSLTLYDAVYAALSQITGAPLITADYKFWSKVNKLSFIEALRELEI